MFETDLIKGLLAIGIGIFSVFSAWFIGNNSGKKEEVNKQLKQNLGSAQDAKERLESINSSTTDEYLDRLRKSSR